MNLLGNNKKTRNLPFHYFTDSLKKTPVVEAGIYEKKPM